MKLYICEIDGLMDLPGRHLIGMARRERLLRYLRREDQARCLAAGLLLRRVLGICEDKLCKGPYGKPYLPDGRQFNLSHSGRYVILGVSNAEIGVDVEKIAPFDDRVVRRCFTAEEKAWLYETDSENRFYRLWTAKESVMKATGAGFHMPPETFCVLPMEDGLHMISGKQWYLRWAELPGHAVCVACGQAEELHITWLTTAQLVGE